MNAKVGVFALSAILFLQIVSFGENPFIPHAEAIEYSSYENLILDYKIDYPTDWVKEESEGRAQGLISDDDFIKGIQYLVEQGIIIV